MAAGDVTIIRDVTLRKGTAGHVRMVWGTVVLDGGNPTPVNLSGYVSALDQAVVSMDGSAAPNADPTAITSSVSGATINIYAWKITGAADATLIASTDNARIINWFAVGPKA